MSAVCANRRATEYKSILNARRSFSRFRRFPEPLRLIPDSHCCFAFSLSSLLECCPQTLSRKVGWAKAHHLYSFEFEERGESL